MTSKRGRRRNRPTAASFGTFDLSSLTREGARTRRHQFTRDLTVFMPAIMIAFLIQSIVYFVLVTRTGSPKWGQIATVTFVLAWVPTLSAATLSILRRNEAPLTTAILTVAVFFSFAVSLVSAVRVPVSYVGLGAVAPLIMVVMAVANIKFHASVRGRIALLDFPEAQQIAANLGKSCRIIADPTATDFDYDILLIDPRHHYTEAWSNVLAECYLRGVELMPWSRYVEMSQGRVDVQSFNVSHLSYSPSQLVYVRMKRILDICAVILTLPLTVPLAAIVAAYIFARDGGPVIFVQHRRGLDAKPFRLYKFRTMYKGTAGGATGKGDSRIIPGCRFLRRTRLDELPQLYNILIGDMSLIGPRPEAVDLVRWYLREIPQYKYRILVHPGLTGWAQVQGGYTSNPAEARIKLSYDLYYIKHMSLDLDLRILIKTVRTVLFGAGAR